MLPSHPGGIPRANAGIITDELLEEGIAAGQALRDGTMTERQGRVLWLIAGPALDELLQRRRAGSVPQVKALDLSNVRLLRGVA